MMLQVQIPAIVRAIHKQLKEKSIKTRQGCFNLLTELVLVLPGALTEHIPSIVPGIQFSLGYILYKLFNSFSAWIDFGCQNLTSKVDPNTEGIKYL